MKLENIIFSNLLYNEEYARKTLPHLKREYFHDTVDQKIYDIIDQYVEKYQSPPSKSAIQIDLKNSGGLSEDQYRSAASLVDSFEQNDAKDLDWLINTTESFCQDKAIYNAIMSSIKILDEKDGKFNKGNIPHLLSDALGVSFDTNIGHDYIENAPDRFDYYHKKIDRIPFDLDVFNKATDGGLIRKTLTCFMAAPHGGKTLVMNHLSAAYLMAGLNVLYVTLEMSEEEISKRIDANLLDIAMDQIDKLDSGILEKKMTRIKSTCKGKLIVKEYAEGTISASNLRYLLNELKLKLKFIPDVIVIDYINLCASSRLKMGNTNSYEYVKAIAQEMRGLMKEANAIGITATQVNRGGSSASDMEMSDVSECIAVGEKVMLTTGEQKNIEDIVPGDQVISNDEFKTVMMTHHRKPKECIKITTKSGKNIIVSKDHIFPTNNGRLSFNSGLKLGTYVKTI